ncbi:MAG: WbuC family cupin fold metalloprotein [Bacteroidia bacterium]|nr:WbuC family cupin fold metalloprotein [Bacteroidia bacterium]
MIKIDKSLLDHVSQLAKESPRGRKNYNFHKTYNDSLQRLLNAIEPYSYIQPHKHENPDKREVFTVLQGRLLVVEFDAAGNITDHCIIAPAEGSYGAEIPEGTFHSIFALEPDTIVYEIKDGPYSPIDDKNFAPWAPREGAEGTKKYIEGILNRLDIPLPHLD